MKSRLQYYILLCLLLGKVLLYPVLLAAAEVKPHDFQRAFKFTIHKHHSRRNKDEDAGAGFVAEAAENSCLHLVLAAPGNKKERSLISAIAVIVRDAASLVIAQLILTKTNNLFLRFSVLRI